MSLKGIMNSAVVGLMLAASGTNAQDAPETNADAQTIMEQAEAEATLDQVVPVAGDAAPAGQPPEETEAAPQTDEELLIEQFERYRALMADEILDEAENVAKRVIELAIRVHGPDSVEMARALTNLGIVQHRNAEYQAAQQNYEAAIEIIEDNEDRLNSLLLNPLRGMGAAQLEGGRPDLAAKTFGRAVHITHVNEGPHNMQQLGLLESLAETNLRMGLVKEAKQVHDAIYALNLRHYQSDPIKMIPSLMRRAKWQHKTGYINDERATYRRIIRIIESVSGKYDVRLIPPLTNLGRSYFFLDLSGTDQLAQPGATSGEIYFKRALRIARESENSNWAILADALLSLGDYYLFQNSIIRARSQYLEAWELLSKEDSRLQKRDEALGQVHALRLQELPRYTGSATSADVLNPDEDLREGQLTFTYGVNERGRVIDFKMIEATPPELYDIQRQVRREMRSRLYRPRYENSEAVETTGLTMTHTFFYRQSDLEEIREQNEEASGTDETD